MNSGCRIVYATSSTYVLADIRVAQSRLLDAISTYKQALQHASAQGEPELLGTSDMYLRLSELYRERGDEETARQHRIKSEKLGQSAALDEWPYRLLLVQARIKEDQGDLDSGLELLDEAERLHYRGPVPDVRPISALKARVWTRQGRVTEALDWARTQALSVDDDLSYLREFEHITLARALLAQYQHTRAEHAIEDALRLLARLLNAAEEGGRMGGAIEILILQALAHQVQANVPLALVSLKRALTLAEPEGYVRLFADEGEPMRLVILDFKLWTEKESRSHDHKMIGYLDNLLSAFALPEPMSQSKFSNQKSTMVEPLSPRELEVLQLIARGLSNQEIGERLFLALNTVKGHKVCRFSG